MAISPVSFLNTPQAGDDLWFYTEDELLLLGGSAQLILDVMANDTGGKAKTLFSIDDGAGNPIIFNGGTWRQVLGANAGERSEFFDLAVDPTNSGTV